MPENKLGSLANVYLADNAQEIVNRNSDTAKLSKNSMRQALARKLFHNNTNTLIETPLPLKHPNKNNNILQKKVFVVMQSRLEIKICLSLCKQCKSLDL